MKKCPKCETLNSEASSICINCRARLEETKVNNAYTKYEIQQEKDTQREEKMKNFEYWWIVIDIAVTVIFLLIFLANK